MDFIFTNIHIAKIYLELLDQYLWAFQTFIGINGHAQSGKNFKLQTCISQVRSNKMMLIYLVSAVTEMTGRGQYNSGTCCWSRLRQVTQHF